MVIIECEPEVAQRMKKLHDREAARQKEQSNIGMETVSLQAILQNGEFLDGTDLVTDDEYDVANMVIRKAQIEELNQKIEHNYELFKERLVFAQESGTMSYIDFILGAEDLSDIMSRGEVINDMLAYDRQIIQEIGTRAAKASDRRRQE